MEETLKEIPVKDLEEYRNALIKVVKARELDEIENDIKTLKKYRELHEKFNKVRKNENDLVTSSGQLENT